jgi:hypothetical protein
MSNCRADPKRTLITHSIAIKKIYFLLFSSISGFALVPRYPLIVASRYNIPYLLDAPGVGHRILGEVYSVDNAMLSALDALEDAPNYYSRKIEKARSRIAKCHLSPLLTLGPGYSTI